MTPFQKQQEQRNRLVACYSNADSLLVKSEESKELEEGTAEEGKEDDKKEEEAEKTAE